MLVLLAMLNEDAFPGEISLDRLCEAVARLVRRSAQLRQDVGPALDQPQELKQLLVENPDRRLDGRARNRGRAVLPVEWRAIQQCAPRHRPYANSATGAHARARGLAPGGVPGSLGRTDKCDGPHRVQGHSRERQADPVPTRPRAPARHSLGHGRRHGRGEAPRGRFRQDRSERRAGKGRRRPTSSRRFFAVGSVPMQGGPAPHSKWRSSPRARDSGWIHWGAATGTAEQNSGEATHASRSPGSSVSNFGPSPGGRPDSSSKVMMSSFS